MIPQDARSQLQQQRWIEIYNAGAYDIPAYGVVEIVENTDNHDEFRSTLSVQRPTRWGCPHVLINGPIPVAVGKVGWATRDYPAYALCESLSAGRMCGTEADSFVLTADVPGFSVCGGGPAGVRRVQLDYVTEVEATLAAELCPASALASISGAEECEAMDITTALNLFAVAGPAGSRCTIWWSNKSQDWVVKTVKNRVWSAVTNIYSDEPNCRIKQSRYLKMVGMWCESTTDSTAIQMYNTDVVTDVYTADDGSGVTETCKLKQVKKTICTLNDVSSDPGNTTTAMNFNLIEVLVDVSLNESTGWIEGDTWYVFVPCDDPGRTVNLIDTTPCDTSSS